jgi:hypothetical protein
MMWMDRRFGVAALLALIGGWLLAPLPEEAVAPVQARQDAWRPMESPRRPAPMSAAVEVAAAPFWGMTPAARGASAPAAEPPPPDPGWRLAGTFGRGAERRVIVTFRAEGKRDEFVGVGGVLPSGHRIVSISDTEVCVRIGGQGYRLAIERAGS